MRSILKTSVALGALVGFTGAALAADTLEDVMKR